MIKKIAILVSFVVFCTSSFDAFGSKIVFDDLSDDGKKTTVVLDTAGAEQSIIDQIPEDVLKLIILEMFKTTNPCSLTSVCKSWHSIIRENNAPKTILKFSDLNTFLKDGMKAWWKNEGRSTDLGQLFNGQLVEKLVILEERIYQPSELEDLFKRAEENIYQLSSLDDPFKGAIEFSFHQCGDTDRCVFTTDVERFSQVAGNNKWKSVILIALRQQVEKESKKNPNYLLTKFLASWDKKATLGLFFRWGNCGDLDKIDYLTSATLSEISSRNLDKNWEQSTQTGIPGQASLSRSAQRLHVRFNRNNDIDKTQQ